jgi:chromosome partitioning protein
LFTVIGLARETLHVEAPVLARNADYVVIDGPPRVTGLARSALLAADLVLIPVQPSPYDVWASDEMVDLVREASMFRPRLRAAFVINRRVTGTVLGREARPSLQHQRVLPLDSEIFQRIIYAESVASGRLAYELDPASLAAREVSRLTDEVIGLAP